MASQPRQAFLALAALSAVPLLGIPLVGLAQTAVAPDTGSVTPEPASTPFTSDPLPVAPPPPLPAAAVPAPASSSPPAATTVVPLSPAPTTAIEPVRPAQEERRSLPPPRRFDASLDALVRDGVVSPQERVRVRGGILVPPSLGLSNQMCRNGALSEQECSTGVVFRGLGRPREDQPGTTASAGSFAGLGGERYGIDAAPLPPITVPVTALLSGAGGNFRLTDIFRVTPRPSPIAGNGNRLLLFPLIGSAVTTSNFGWRLHPVLGNWLMHAGRDLAAPEGTPVVAALSGRVVSSGLAGGYGLAVEVEHEGPRRRTLYGHLSELYVKEGERVRQGEVIGRVGSTGLSTGPHLHFELRLPQEGGWVATDPGDLDPGGSMIAGTTGLPGIAGQPGSASTDAVALLMGQLIQTLERPRSPLALPATSDPARKAANSYPASRG